MKEKTKKVSIVVLISIAALVLAISAGIASEAGCGCDLVSIEESYDVDDSVTMTDTPDISSGSVHSDQGRTAEGSDKANLEPTSTGKMLGNTDKDIPQQESEILVRVYVVKDPPIYTDYELMEGTPACVGVYRYYLKDPMLPGTGTFELIDQIPLEQKFELTFYGEKRIKKIEDTLCIGYPPTNFIDGYACVRVNQTKEGVEATVHYWKTSIAVDSCDSQTLEGWIPFDDGILGKPPTISVPESSHKGIVVDVDVPGMFVEQKEVDGEIFHVLTIPKYGYTPEIGKPQLPVIRLQIAVPASADVELNVLDSEYSKLEGYNVYPVQEPIPEAEHAKFAIDRDFYSLNSFYPAELAKMGYSGWLREFRIIQLELNPVWFNPVSKELKVYSNLKIELVFTGGILEEMKRPSKSFDKIYRSSILNYDVAEEWVPVEEAPTGEIVKFKLPPLEMPEVEIPSDKNVQPPEVDIPINQQSEYYLKDLSGVKIAYDKTHGERDGTYYDMVKDDLIRRGASITYITAGTITRAVLDNYDILWINEVWTGSDWSHSELMAVREWIRDGGSLLIQGDDHNNNNEALTSMFAIDFTGTSGNSGYTSNLQPHYVTQGVYLIYVSGPLNSLDTAWPAQTIVYDSGSKPTVAVSQYGHGRVCALADDYFFLTSGEPVYASADNRRLSQQAFDWLVDKKPGRYDFDCLIIYPPSWKDSVRPLYEWKTLKGIRCLVVDTNYIYTYYSGSTNQEKIRDFIDSYYQAYDVSYVILVGDVEQVPTYYWENHPYYPSGHQYEPNPTDQWYVQVVGADYFSDLIIGRISAKSKAELDKIVDKIIDYERNPLLAADVWQKKALLISDTGYFETTSNWVYDVLYNQRGYSVVDKCYASSGCTKSYVSAKVNEGRGIVNYRGHGAITYWGTSGFGNTDVYALTNGRKVPVIISPTCECGHFDEPSTDCLGEAWVKPENKGAVAFFGSSRVSYGGYNDELCKGVYKAFFEDGIYGLGAATVRAKLYMYDVYGAGGSQTKRTFNMYHVLGDPTLDVWTEIPMELTVTHPFYVSSGETITVNVKSGGHPLQDALVWVGQEYAPYSWKRRAGYTDSSGNVIFSNIDFNGGVSLTVTKHNYEPYVATFNVIFDTDKIGVWRSGSFLLDYNGNGYWDGGDKIYTFGLSTDTPITGDWNGDGRDEIGVFRNGMWYLDYNGNGYWDAGDKIYGFGLSTDTPITGDWNGDGRDEIGVFRNGMWYLDYNGNGYWDGGDKIYTFGLSTDTPITGDWNGDGRDEIGVFRNGMWYLDYNGNGYWDAGDKFYGFGVSTDTPITGDWNGGA